MKTSTKKPSRRKGVGFDPIILREGERVRLVFHPSLASITDDPRATIHGFFSYQRKGPTDRWSDLWPDSLSSLKGGEGFRLTLHAEELRRLLNGLVPIYKPYTEGSTSSQGRLKTAVKLDRNVARFATNGEADLAAFLGSGTEDPSAILLKLVKWLATSREGADAAKRLAAVAPEQMPEFMSALGLAAPKNAVTYWRENETSPSEEFWQLAISKRAYVLSQAFAYPIVILNSKAYLGGKQTTNTGGNIVDFLAAVESTDAVVLIEIKTPLTKVLGPEYRNGAYPLSSELTGALAQVLRYRQSLMQEFHNLTSGQEKRPTLGEPRCLVIAGHAKNQLKNPAMRESCELQRDRLQGATIITYDELFGRVAQIIALIEGHCEAGHNRQSN